MCFLTKAINLLAHLPHFARAVPHASCPRCLCLSESQLPSMALLKHTSTHQLILQQKDGHPISLAFLEPALLVGVHPTLPGTRGTEILS